MPQAFPDAPGTVTWFTRPHTATRRKSSRGSPRLSSHAMPTAWTRKIGGSRPRSTAQPAPWRSDRAAVFNSSQLLGRVARHNFEMKSSAIRVFRRVLTCAVATSLAGPTLLAQGRGGAGGGAQGGAFGQAGRGGGRAGG